MARAYKMTIIVLQAYVDLLTHKISEIALHVYSGLSWRAWSKTTE